MSSREEQAQPVKLAFASGSEDLIGQYIEEVEKMGDPSLPILLVSEFPPPPEAPSCQWIPWNPPQGWTENTARIRWHLRGKRVLYCAILLQPRQAYWLMRFAGMWTAPTRIYFFNENYGHFPLHPRGARQMFRHLLWRAKNWVRYEFRPGGSIFTFFWRLGHPFAWERPIYARIAKLRRPLRPLPAPPPDAPNLADGITVIIPSRDGRHMLEKLLPQVLAEPEVSRVLVVDNGSSDNSEELRQPRVDFLVSTGPLSFAAAVNRGISAATTKFVCLLNNDMEIEPGFFRALRQAFVEFPGLFCATAQIFFPADKRREETGKAVYWPGGPRDLPLRCLEPLPGENYSPVLYGSGGCSLYDVAKLRAIGSFRETFRPAYVEDLDTGWRGWQQDWPTVFVAGAKLTHHHQSTTRKVFAPSDIELAVEQNFLRWILGSITDREVFNEIWLGAVNRLNLRAAVPEPKPIETFALRFAAFYQRQKKWETPLVPRLAEKEILALGSGKIASFPGNAQDGRPVVIVCSCYLPYPLSHGGAVRMFNLLREAAREYRVVLLSFVDESGPVPGELLALCAEVHTVTRAGSHTQRTTHLPRAVEDFESPAFAAMLRWLVRRHQPFAVQLEFTQLAQYAEAAKPAKTILVEHDITLDLYQQMLARKEDYDLKRELERWTNFETEAWRNVDTVVVMSERDRQLVTDARNISVIENGVDLERFTPSSSTPEHKRLFFLASFAHLPNLLALGWFLNDVWPLLQGYHLHVIAGKNPDYWLDHYREQVQAAWRQPGVELEGFVSDVRPSYGRAEIVIAPLGPSAGTNIKILEALAMGKAIVSTPGGVNGLQLKDGSDFLLASTPAEFAAQIKRLSQDPALRQQLEKQARATAERRFGWRAMGAKQRELYESLRAMQQ
jgi:glycosyltransferase involved in cell wall biosynthesis/GT2 family glycosyltransferase